MNGEYRKMEKELRDFCGGNIIVPDGEEEKYLRRGRMQILRVKKKEKPATRRKMGGISKLRRIIRAIFSEEDHEQDHS